MLCAIYKSSKRPDTYLFVRQRDDFSDIPTALLNQFGQPQFVMLLSLDAKRKLALSDIQQVRDALQDKGFYLQLPPTQQNLLEQHNPEFKEMRNG